jgi:hypothetical protein
MKDFTTKDLPLTVIFISCAVFVGTNGITSGAKVMNGDLPSTPRAKI